MCASRRSWRCPFMSAQATQSAHPRIGGCEGFVYIGQRPFLVTKLAKTTNAGPRDSSLTLRRTPQTTHSREAEYAGARRVAPTAAATIAIGHGHGTNRRTAH